MQTLELQDYNRIKRYLDEANYEGYNSNFVTMMMWNHEYHIEYEMHDHFLIMLQTYQNRRYFAMPFCKKEYYQEAIEYMMQYAKKHHIPFMMDCVIGEVKQSIKKLYGSSLLAIRTAYNDDYIYDKQALVSLSGKKMQKRRNHFNAFLRENNNYIYKEIEDEDIDQVLGCLRRWDHNHENEESVQSEFIGIMYLLMHRNQLDIKTGCIYINGVLEAFTIASPLKHQTIQIHVEKANKDIRGLYVAISKFFLENNYPEYLYVNREEDMGIDSLRQAKRSLHPIKMVEKYIIKENQIVYQKAKPEDKKAIIDLWQDSFQDEDEDSTNFYFSTCYKTEHTFVAKDNDTIIAAMQIVPYTIENNKKIETIYFILGVCTDCKYQQNGIMKKLINDVLQSEPYRQHRIFLQAYNPNVYRSLGFQETYYHQRILVDSDMYAKDTLVTVQPLNPAIGLSLYQTFVQRFTGYRIRNLAYYKDYLLPRCIAFDDQCKQFYRHDQLLGYCIYHEDDINIYIQEIIYLDEDSLSEMIGYFGKEKSIVIECDMTALISGKSEIICTMMTNDYEGNETNPSLYINEIF